MSLVFYDTETTDKEKAFCQILQFAAIRTDDELKIQERFEIRSRLMPHIVPSPHAMLVTGLTVAQLTDKSLPTHYEMTKAIRDKLRSWTPSIFLGYNTIDFDEYLLRQAFYQSLLPIYLTNTDGNSRIDILKLLHAAYLYAPGVINMPVRDDGKPTFKLDLVAPLNGFAHEKAHDAMADVEATIYMCRLIRERAPALWESFYRFSKKKAVKDYAFGEPVFSLSEYSYGRPYSSLVTTIGIHPRRDTDIFVFDLAFDPSLFVGMPADTLAAALDKSPRPVRVIKSNACPILRPATDAPALAEARDLGAEELNRRAQFLKSEPSLKSALVEAVLSNRAEEKPHEHIEEQIYDGFYNDDDNDRIQAFNAASWETRLQLTSQFEDKRLRQLSSRLIYLEHPELLPPSVRHDFDVAIAKRVMADDKKIPWMTFPKAIAAVESLLEAPDNPKQEFLREHREYLLDRLQAAQGLIPKTAEDL